MSAFIYSCPPMQHQWRRQLWGTGARASPSIPTISILVPFGVNLSANYPSIV